MATKKAVTSTAVAVKTNSNVISIKDALKAQAAGVSERTAPAGGSQIRITQDKYFVLPDGTKTNGPLDLVVVDFAAENRYYATGFDSKNVVPPNCFALGSNPLRLVPSAKSPELQAQECNICPQNEFGSNPNGKGGKACNNTRILAVLPPDADDKTPMWKLGVSATACKSFDGFVTSVARIFEMPPVGVVVKVGFDDSVTYAKLVFSDPQPNENVTIHFARQDEAKAMLAVEPDVSKFVAKPIGKKVAAGGRR